MVGEAACCLKEGNVFFLDFWHARFGYVSVNFSRSTLNGIVLGFKVELWKAGQRSGVPMVEDFPSHFWALVAHLSRVVSVSLASDHA